MPKLLRDRGHNLVEYSLRMTGEGLTYQERHHQQVNLLKCNMNLAAGSLTIHWQVQRTLGQGDMIDKPQHPWDDPKKYWVYLPREACLF